MTKKTSFRTDKLFLNQIQPKGQRRMFVKITQTVVNRVKRQILAISQF